MPWTTLIANEYLTMEYSPDKKIIYHTFHQPIIGVVFRECLKVGLEMMHQYGARKWLSDERKNLTIPQEDLEWSRTEWAEQAIAAGWKYWAIIAPEDEVGHDMMMGTKNFYRERGVKLMVFLSPKAALEWLEAI